MANSQIYPRPHLSSLTPFNICRGAKVHNQRTGQFLYNSLPSEVCSRVAGTLFDPFFDDLTADEIQSWIDNHLIFDGGEIVGVFDKNNILWIKEI